MKIVRIYVLIDPVTLGKRYVGKTIEQLSDRLKVHLFQSKNSKKPTYKEAWIKGLLLNNKKPLIELLEECNENNWTERERHWIAFAKGAGWPITNLSDGGDGPCGSRHSDEFKKKLSERMKGNKNSLGKKWSEEQREAMKNRVPWNKGREGVQRFSEESKRKRSERMRGDNHHGAKLTDMQIIEMRRRFNVGDSPKIISIDYNITYSHCVKIVTNKTRIACVPS